MSSSSSSSYELQSRCQADDTKGLLKALKSRPATQNLIWLYVDSLFHLYGYGSKGLKSPTILLAVLGLCKYLEHGGEIEEKVEERALPMKHEVVVAGGGSMMGLQVVR
ncbi:hypothetical protein Tco_0286857 [Tanacetum coccineum]